MHKILTSRKKSTFNRLLTFGALISIITSLFIPSSVMFVTADAPTAASYIIVFKDNVNPAAEASSMADAYGLQTGFVYQHALKGMSAMVPAGRLVALQHDPRVAYVVPDLERHISVQEIPTGIRRIFADSNTNIDIDGIDDYRVNVDVAVIDTGIDFQHPQLNVAGGVNCTVSIIFPRCDPGGDDDHYHGTHVAGTIGAIDDGDGVVGVAPGARLWAVKVLNKRGSGYTSWIIAGIDWVAANAATIEVANMSLGGAGYSQAEYDAIQGAINKGVAFAVAAGNESDDARNYSPGGFDNVLSVSALADFNGLPGGGAAPTCRTDVDDTLADFSNWGLAIDIAAPGVCILSTYPLEKGSYGTISGTSMASPHAAGALALLASRNNPGNATDVYNLYNQIKNNGNLNWTDDSGDGIQEPLLDVSNAAIFNPVLEPGSGGNQPPVANFTFNATALTVNFIDAGTDSDGTIASWSWTFGDGGNSALQNPTHDYVAAGTYDVTLTVTDNEGATGSITKPVSVSDAPGGTVTVSSLTGNSSTVNKNFWKATVVATIDPALSGAVVSGSWNGGTAASCTTDTSGMCSVSINVRTNTASITFNVNNVALSGYSYTPGVITVTVYKP